MAMEYPNGRQPQLCDGGGMAPAGALVPAPWQDDPQPAGRCPKCQQLVLVHDGKLGGHFA